MPVQPRPEIEKMEASAHGGPDETAFREAGLTADEIIDFSVCANPYMPPPDMNEVLRQVSIDRLPDSEATAFREKLAENIGLPPEKIMAGNGALEPIRLIAQAYFGPGDKVMILEPTFGEYAVAVDIAGADIISQKAGETNGFHQDADKIAEFISAHRPKGVFICNPNNPTGHYLSRAQIEVMADASDETLLVLDEAYISFVDKSWNALELTERDNIVVIRSMTKDFALAGLRLGYAAASQEIIDTLRKVRPPWSVNAIAQQAGITALNDYGKLEETRRQILEARDYLVDEFKKMGFETVFTETHFFLMKTTDPPEFRATLLKHGLLVRDCASFGLPGYIRIAARTLPECRILVKTVKDLGLR